MDAYISDDSDIRWYDIGYSILDPADWASMSIVAASLKVVERPDVEWVNTSDQMED